MEGKKKKTETKNKNFNVTKKAKNKRKCKSVKLFVIHKTRWRCPIYLLPWTTAHFSQGGKGLLLPQTTLHYLLFNKCHLKNPNHLLSPMMKKMSLVFIAMNYTAHFGQEGKWSFLSSSTARSYALASTQ